MDEKIFRKKSIENIMTPDELNDYVRVTTPSAWLIIIALIIIVVGVIVWSIFGKLLVSKDVAVFVKNHEATLVVDHDDLAYLHEYTELDISDKKTFITAVENEYNDEFGGYMAYSVVDLPDGTYKGVLIFEKVTPFKFITN